MTQVENMKSAHEILKSEAFAKITAAYQGRQYKPDHSPEEIAAAEKAEEQRRLDFEKRRAEMAESERRSWASQVYTLDRYKLIPTEMDSIRLANIESDPADADALNLIKAWRPSDRFGFVIIGPAGSGKTHILKALLNRIVLEDREFSENRWKLRWFPVSRGLDQIRQEMGQEYDGLKQEVLSSHYLFLDDMGAENLTDWSREQLYQIYEHRLNRGFVTFISSNCSLDEFKARYHERFISRLKETTAIIQLKGRDRRNDLMKANLQILRERVKQAVPKEGA